MFTAHPLLSSVVSTQYGYRKLQTPKHYGPKNTCTKRRRPVPECLKILWLSGHFRPITAIICKVISYKCPDNSVRILWVQSILGPVSWVQSTSKLLLFVVHEILNNLHKMKLQLPSILASNFCQSCSELLQRLM